MRLFAGIDGGQSSTAAVIAGEDGRILGRGRGGAADEVWQGAASTRLHDALAQALSDACANAKIDPGSHFESIVAGISGYEGRVYGKAPELPTNKLALMHDAPIAHAGAFAGDSGVVVIAGTGSVGYGVNDRGETLTVGGWGYLFGDEGSAFGIVRDVISDAARDTDAGEISELMPPLLRYFGASSLRALVRAFYTGSVSRESLAAYAAPVVEAAERGNAHAAQYCLNAATALALLASRAADRLAIERPRVAFIGGLLCSLTMREQISQCTRAVLPAARQVQPRYDPAAGALLLAYKAAGVPLPELTS
ncbi:MAG: N-acetylglucosamine kinase [Vulcanimicrobiaceae bacterium]